MNRKHCNLWPGNQKVVTDLYNAYWVKGLLVISGQQKSIQVIRRCLTYTKNQNPTLYCVIYKCPGHLSHRLMVTDWQRNLDDLSDEDNYVVSETKNGECTTEISMTFDLEIDKGHPLVQTILSMRFDDHQIKNCWLMYWTTSRRLLDWWADMWNFTPLFCHRGLKNSIGQYHREEEF